MTVPETKRVAFTVHYDGAAFYGWQLQRGQPSVQGELERVLAKLFAAPTRVIGSGRTDRGVHATGQVAAADVPGRWGAAELRRALNALLPASIWVADLAEVPSRFHPRYDALSRAYVYHVGLAEESRSPFHAPWCWPLVRPLDLAAMEVATLALRGEHSFRSFAKAGQEERGDRCMVLEARWSPWSPLGTGFAIIANRFLHHMVRYLVGTLVEIGLGRRPTEDLARLLAGAPEIETSPPAPPQGLFLTAVHYPPGTYEGPASAHSGGAPGPPRLA